MIAYVVNRLFQAVLVMLAVAMIGFIVSNTIGDPVNNMLGQEATQQDRAELRERLGLNDPVPVRFVRFVSDALAGDFGISFQLKRPVSVLIGERLPATLELVFVAAVLALSLGIVLGVYTGLRPRSIGSQIVLVVSLLGVSLPTFVIGILMIYVFAVLPQGCQSDVTIFGWTAITCDFVRSLGLPAFGRGIPEGETSWLGAFFSAERWRTLLMPAVTLSLLNLTLILRLVRSEMLEVLRTDYIKFARARGLTDRAVNFGHALKNTLVPVITIAGIQIGTLIAFSIVTETVFQWPGMGLLFVQAVQFADVPIMTAYLVLAALVFVTISFLVDLTYAAIDPRMRSERTGGRT